MSINGKWKFEDLTWPEVNEAAEKGGNILASSNKALHKKILRLLKPFTKND